MIRLTRSDPSRNMNRFYAMQLGNWVTNPARGQAANLARSVTKILNTVDRPTPQRALRAPCSFCRPRKVVLLTGSKSRPDALSVLQQR
jgi:hypothetical protein